MFIRRLTIQRYRGIERLEWQPVAGINCLVGPADAGKTTVLAAISLLLAPTPVTAASEFDYYRRRIREGFEIEGVLGGLDEKVLATMRLPPLRGWLGGELRPLADENGAESVLVARAVGSPELEIRHELLPPSGDPLAFTVGLREKLLLSRVSGEERAARELRLAQGSLLERHLGRVDLRANLLSAVAAASTAFELPTEAAQAVERLREVFGRAGLPADLKLGLIAPQGFSLVGLVGLLAGQDPAEAVPLAYAGTGTRQMALFWLTAALFRAEPIIVFDEPEAGLEPYRQRILVRELRRIIGQKGQAFLTTHSPAILRALESRELWRLSLGPQPRSLAGDGIERLTRDAPDALLARLPVLCEGSTESGVMRALLEARAAAEGTSLDALGFQLVSRGGQPSILAEAEDLLNAGIACGLFVDAEALHAGRRTRLAEYQQCAFGSWEQVRNVEEAVARWSTIQQLDELIKVAADLQAIPVEYLHQQVAARAGKPGKTPPNKLVADFGEPAVRKAIGDAMQENSWFKSENSAEVLGRTLLRLGVPPEIGRITDGFWQRLTGLA